MSLDTERVIIEVQCHPTIWDQSNEQYKDRDARTAAWLQICRELFPEFDGSSEAEKKVTVNKIQSRWKTARDTYMKVKSNKKKLKSGAGARMEKKYIFYDMLKFLDSNASTEGDESTASLNDDHSSSNYIMHLSTTQSTTINEPVPSTSNHSSVSRKRKRTPSPSPFEKKLLQSVIQNSVDNNDEDLNFFRSLIPTIKKLNTFKKLLFRTKVLEALMDIEKETIITVEDLSTLNLGTIETESTSNMIDLTSLNIESETQNTNATED